MSDIPPRWRPIGRALAMMSYPLYAIHYPFILLVGRFVPAHLQAIAALSTVAGLGVVSLVLARWYEKPVSAWLKRMLVRR